MFKVIMCKIRLDSSGSRYRPLAAYCENGNELLGSIKVREICDQLIACRLLKKDFTVDSWIAE
jgi:hypothetical protein